MRSYGCRHVFPSLVFPVLPGEANEITEGATVMRFLRCFLKVLAEPVTVGVLSDKQNHVWRRSLFDVFCFYIALVHSALSSN